GAGLRVHRSSLPVRLPAEEEVVAARLAGAVRAADEDVGRDAAEVVDHVVVDEAREAAVVRPDLGPGGRMAGRHLAVVDRRTRVVVVNDEVAGPGQPGEILMVVAPELAPSSRRRPAEPLLEEREGGQRVLSLE